jgi:Cdc6-like AAA superfamily ATPase
MDIQEYLNNKRARLEKSSERIKDFSVFDFNYIPPNPLMREEAKLVIDAILRFQRTGIANNLLILGARGSGKSVMAKYLMSILKQDQELNFLYVNSRQHNTSYKIIANLLGISARGSSMDELWGRFSQTYRARTIVVLDEVDLISDRESDTRTTVVILTQSDSSG